MPGVEAALGCHLPSEGFGISIGQPAFVLDFLERKSREQQVFFQRIPWVNDPQAAFLRPGLTAGCGQCGQKTLKFSPHVTTKMSGPAFGRFLGCRIFLQRPTWSPPSLSQQAGSCSPRPSRRALGEFGGFPSDGQAAARSSPQVDGGRVGRRQPLSMLPFLHFEKKTEQSNSESWHQCFIQNMRLLRVGHFGHG